jgi:diacylglycerol O-acyltransferase
MVDVLEGHVRETDAFTMRMERDPLLRSTVTAITLYDRTPDWDVLVERIDRATRLVPSFREKLVASPLGLAPPRWVLDPDFDLSWHLRRVRAPAPRTVDALLGMARVAAMTAFDPARPLWEFTLVDGLTGGRAALLMKVHHSLTDGVGGIDLAAHVVDLQRRPKDLGPMPPVPTARSHGLLDRLGDSVAFDVARWTGVARSMATAAPRAVVQAARHPLGTASAVAETVGSLARFVQPVTTTMSPVMTERRLQWHLDVLDVPFAELKAAGREAGGSLNDAFLAGVTGGLRRYHEQHLSGVGTLRLTMPINVRNADDPAGGNRITLARFEVPVGLVDPAARIRELGSICKQVRKEKALPYSEAVAGVLNLLPPAVTGGMLKHVDFLASNVPGFRTAVYVGGARVDAFYGFGPTIGAAANVTLMSYGDTCNIGITTDVGAVPDADVFLACLTEGFDEVLALARRSAEPAVRGGGRRRAR